MFESLKAKFETFLRLAEQRAATHPWLVVSLMHEYHRNLYPSDSYIPFDKSLSAAQRIDQVLDRCVEALTTASLTGSYFAHDAQCMENLRARLVQSYRERKGEGQTQRVYGMLWDKFNLLATAKEAHELLGNRLQKSGFDLRSLEGKVALDSGCGCGRYTIALAMAGAKQVCGTDLGAASIETARHMAELAGVTNVEFEIADALELPYADESFDFVLSNGVLHHTSDLARGLREIRRVMKSDARSLFYVSGTGGLFWYSRRMIPSVMRRIPQEYAMAVLELLGMPGNRFVFVDNWYVPVEQHLTRGEVEHALGEAGFAGIEKICGTRETDLDVATAHGDDEALALWGEGEHRYLLTKG